MWGMGMHIVRKPKKVLRNICRVLKSGGRLFATSYVKVRAAKSADDIAKKAQAVGFTDVAVREEGGVRYVLQAVKA